MIAVVNWFRSAPYTIAASLITGAMFAPAILALWGQAVDYYDARNPVVRMNAEVIETGENSMVLRLTGEKLRACEFLGIYAYGLDVDGVLHDVHRERVNGETSKTRPVGQQSFGEWRVWPVRFVSIAMYTRHDCDGRVVLTKVLDVPAPAGAIPATSGSAPITRNLE